MELVLFYISIGVGNIGLRLIVIIVKENKILHGVFRKNSLNSLQQLRRKSFVVRKHQSGAVKPCNDICRRKGLAGAGNTQQHPPCAGRPARSCTSSSIACG